MLRRQSLRAAEELQALRVRAGISQAAVAIEVGVARSVISRLEQGDPTIVLRTRFRVATILGADLRLTAYAGSSPLIRDAAQAWIVERLLEITDRRWRPGVEAAIPGAGRRSVDLMLRGPEDLVLIEVETRLSSIEEIIRELHSKRQAIAGSSDTGPVRRSIHVVLVLPRTHRNRSVTGPHPKLIGTAFPVPTTALKRALADASLRWPGDGILWVSPTKREPT